MNQVEVALASSRTESDELDALLWKVLWKPLGFPRDIRSSFKVAGTCLELVAKTDGNLLGGLVANWTSPTDVELRHLGVKSHVQAQGIGRQLVKQLILIVSEQSCARIHTIARNTSVDFFKKLGFTTQSGKVPEHPVFKEHGITFELLEYHVRVVPIQKRRSCPYGAPRRRKCRAVLLTAFGRITNPTYRAVFGGGEMLLIVEIAMLIGGIWAIVTGKVPSFLVGGGKYQVEGLAARLFGVLLVLPLPVAFLGAFVLVLLFGEDGTGYAALLELVTVLGVAVLAVVLMRVVGKRVEVTSGVEAVIAKKAQGALMYALFSATGVGALICCPLAFVYASQALRLIDEHGVGEQHRGKAQAARIISGAFTLLWVVAIVCIVSGVLVGTR